MSRATERYPQNYEAAVPIEYLREHPDNPRRGDVDALDASMEHHGFYGAVYAQRGTGRIIAGNHRLRVAAERGESTLPVIWLDVDDDQARRILLVDNRSNDLATYDEADLLDLLRSLADLDGTGYATHDIDRLIEQLEPAALDADALSPFDRSAEHTCPFCRATWVDTPEGPVRQ